MNTRSKHIGVLIITWILIHGAATALLAGTTGKIAGRVVDKQTGQPLTAVNVRLDNTRNGDATDTDGYFTITNIPPGIYSVRFTLLAYGAHVVTNVLVRVDLTTTVNAELTESAISGEEVIVEAQRPMINKDETSKMNVITAESFSDLPVTNIDQVVGLQAGFVTDASGELHARGGRSNEVMFLVDGLPTRDPLNGALGMQLDKYAIQELQVLTGGFSAEYGQALSGIVNIVTKEGGDKYSGRVEFQSSQLNASPYRSVDALALDSYGRDTSGNIIQRTDGKGTTLIRDIPSAYKPQRLEETPHLGPELNMLGQLWLRLSGPVPLIDNMRFFVSARYLNELSPMPWGYNKERELNTKFTYSAGNWKLNAADRHMWRMYKPYSHAWKYRPEGYEDRRDYSSRDNLTVNYVPGGNTTIGVSLAYNQRTFERFTPGKYALFSPEGVLLESNYLKRDNNVPPFWINADNGVYYKNEIKTFLGKGDITSQLDRYNLLKAGFETKLHSIDRLSFEEPYFGGFHAYDKFAHRPMELAAYVQNKLEFSTFIMNIGARVDYVDVNDTRWPSVSVPSGYVDPVTKQWIKTGEVKADPKWQVSPRIGIALPITDQTVFYSSYGHFFQIPDYIEMYNLRDPTVDRALVGNPGIEPQRTVASEFGVKQQLGTDFSIEVSAYIKNMTNLVGSTYHAVFPYEYTIYDNSNYGEVNGIDVTLNKRMSHFFGGSITYTYSVAKGNESDPNEGYNDYRRTSAILRPKRVFYLDFDRAHVLSSLVNVSFPERFGPEVAGIYPFERTNMNFIIQAASGLPYTPDPAETGDQLIVEKNSGRKPATFQVDVRVERIVPVMGVNFSVYVDVRNLFDTKNALDVWSATGDPWDSGPIASRTLDRSRNPSNLDIRRSIHAGIRIDF